MKNVNVLFHVMSQDFFGTLSSVLKLVREQPECPNTNNAVLRRAEIDLLYLQENYDIIMKVKPQQN